MSKIADGLKYVGKNFWKVLPIGSGINFSNNRIKNIDKIDTFGYEFKSFLHSIYAFAGIAAVGGYLSAAIGTSEWKPKEINKYFNELNQEANIEREKIRLINEEYYKMIEKENPETFQDSLDIYLKYGFPIKLVEPTPEQRKSALERMTKE